MGLFDLKNIPDFFFIINLVSGQLENFYIKKMVVASWKTQASKRSFDLTRWGFKKEKS